MMRNKLVAIAILVCMILNITIASAKSAVVLAESIGLTTGICGDNLTWSLDANGVLVISGSGSMFNYSNEVSPFYDLRDSVREVIIDNGVTSVGDQAFKECTSITSVFLPLSVITIGNGAFWKCTNLVNIEIPSGLTTIGFFAFRECKSLKDIQLSDSIVNFGTSIFYDCTNLKNVILPSNISAIPAYTFAFCSSLLSIDLPDGLLSIGKYAFISCLSLSRVDLPESITTIDANAFDSCISLTNILLPEGLVNLGESAFSSCRSITSINLPDSITRIRYATFNDCSSLVEIILPESILQIENQAFSNCLNLRSINIPSKVSSLGYMVFSDCRSLKSISLSDRITTIDSSSFNGCDRSLLTFNVMPDSIAYNFAVQNGFMYSFLVDPSTGYFSAPYVSFHDKIVYIKQYDILNLRYFLNVSKDISFGNITLSASDNSVAMIADGMLAGIGEGSCVVNATYGGLTSSFTIYVSVSNDVTKASGISISESNLEMNKGISGVIPFEITPITTTERKIVWTSSNSAVAEISNGVVTAISPGTATITGTINGFSDSLLVSVKAPLLAISADDIMINKNETSKIQLFYYPYDATDLKTTTYLSSNSNIATVNENGYVTGISPGETTVTVSNGNTKKDVKIKVTSVLESITLNKTTISGSKNASELLVVNFSPLDTTDDKTITWSSSNPAIASVDNNGLVSFVSKGIATITATVGNYAAKCTVIVTEIPLRSISLNYSLLDLVYGESVDLNVIFDPFNTTESKSIVWTTSDETVAKVDSEGMVMGMSSGTATIRATTSDGAKNATCVVTVIVPITGVELDKSELLFTEFNQSYPLAAKILPIHAPAQDLIWTSSSESVATVSVDGVVTAVGNGAAMIVVTTADGQKNTACKVTVAVPVKAITLDKTELFFSEFNQTSMLIPTIMPINAANMNLTWTSSDETVASVNDFGTVTALGNGTTVITVSTEDGNFSASCVVTVTVTVIGVSLDKSELFFSDFQQTSQLVASILPSNAANQNLIWVSSDETVATVSNDGRVTSEGNGLTVITVTTEDGEKSASCYVRVAVPVTGVVLDKYSLDFAESMQMIQLMATIMPSNAANQNLVWSSNDERVATVDAFGKVTAINNGTARISATTEDGQKVATCTVTVAIRLKGITLDQSEIHFNDLSQFRRLIAYIEPSNALNQKITWTSSNELVAKVSYDGVVTSIGIGTAIITATSDEGQFAASCTVIVAIPVDGVILDKNELLFTKLSQSYQFLAKVLPSNAGNQNVSWTSSNESVATVSKDGLVTAVANGTTIITVTTEEGKKSATCLVTVALPVTGVALDKTEIYFTELKQTSMLKATVFPGNAANQDLIWMSSDEAVALVNQYGTVTAVDNGTAVITVTTVDGNYRASATVNVAMAVTDVRLDKQELYFWAINQTDYLSASILPNNAVNQKVTWTSSNESVAIVSADGKVTAVGNGTAVVFVTTEDGQKSAACLVTVVVPVTGVSLDKKELNFTKISQSDILVATIVPFNAANQKLIWSSLDEAVATVSIDGTVTAIGNGSTYIMVSTEDGDWRAFCLVTVAVSVSDVILDKTIIKFTEFNQTNRLLATVIPFNSANQNVCWTSSDESVATVNQFGTVTAMTNGTATITVSTEEGNFTASCIVTVAVPVTSVTLDRNELYFTELNQVSELEATILPLNAANQNIIWTSSDESVALVNSDGVVTSVGNGTATIMATTAEGQKSAACKVTVAVPVTGIMLGQSELHLTAYNQTSQLIATILPSNAANQTLIWTTDNASIATVSSDGVVTAVGNGIASISATTVDGSKTATCIVTVKVPVTGVILDKSELNFTTLTQTMKLVAIVIPGNAANQQVIWTSSDEDVATVKADGTVTAIGNGVAIIKVTTADGERSATCAVTVAVSVTGIALNKGELKFTKIGQVERLQATITPWNALNQKMVWTSSDENVATVSSDGLVTAVGNGSAKITVNTADGSFTDVTDVNVQDYSGIYTINSKNSGLVMDVYDGGTKEGTNIIQYSYHGMENQQWRFDSLGNGYYKITSVLNPEYSIDVFGGGDTMGNRVIQYHYHGGTNQQWKILKNADGSISLMSRLAEENGTNFVLDVFGGGKTEGVNVIQWALNGGDNQKWFLQPVASHTVNFNSNGGTEVTSVSGTERSLITEPAAPVTEGMVFDGWYKDEALTLRWNFASDRIPTTDITLYAKWVKDYSGTYIIRSKNSNLVMDVYGGGTTEGTNIIQYSYHGMTNQQWKFESLNNGYYKITSVLNPEYSIDVYGGGTTMGNRVIQYHYHGGINQQWKILENADGSISLMSRLAEESGTGYLLDVFGGGKTEGVNVIQWVSNNGDNQKWYLENVN
ncbi:Ig-like domain-containing protein [Proteiniclasticum sp. BAD-10]|uniref:Ig-like domain-containing protein n=1 Tax=Proteiniclasticum sediminis TaxID=2804028 RepID=A0A941CPT4_9CLOT|nr:Ig-like domain-containing protein [Proteiniclasticum sediminis]MBR0575076.1 Ig-like domain-containing protein [Proteiniclasticum sediminis]